jgi:hypothetical protein
MKLDTYHSGTRSFVGLARFAGIGLSFDGESVTTSARQPR